MAPRVAIVIDAGATFQTTIELLNQDGTELNTTDMTANSQMRRAYSSSNSVNFTTTLANGSLILSLTAAQTAAVEDGRYVYDVILTDVANNVTRLIEGIATVTPSTTRA